MQPFTNDEIMEGKKCLLNHMRRTKEAEAARQFQIEMTSAKKRKTKQSLLAGNRFSLNVQNAANAETSPEPKAAAEEGAEGTENGAEGAEGDQMKMPR